MGFTCPNRDGNLAIGGCVYCNNDSFVPPYARARFSMHQQITNGMEYLRKRFKAEKFIVYFQSYTNTYDSVEKLEEIYREALKYDDVIGISVGTRSDCIDEEKLSMFEELAKDRFILGSVDDVIQQIQAHRDRLGINHFIFRIWWPGMEAYHAYRVVELMAEHIIPYFRKGAPWRPP